MTAAFGTLEARRHYSVVFLGQRQFSFTPFLQIVDADQTTVPNKFDHSLIFLLN